MGPPHEHFDVLVIGGGLSGIAAGYYLQSRRPEKTFTILEGREVLGGTWDLFRYPGIRSDSDMYTLGFSFRPWTRGDAIADGAAILTYLQETAREYGLDRIIRYGRRVVRASWSSNDRRWTVQVRRSEMDETYTCGFLWACTGYYRYEAGYTPEFPGLERFAGRFVHPQQWTDDIEHAGKRVVVIGSGATAVTLVPALAEQAAHVTMLQRSPTWVISRPRGDVVARVLERLAPARPAAWLIRWKNVLLNLAFYLGYTNASWTLKCELTSEDDVPLIDFSSGYVQRALDILPRQGARTPWRLHQNYLLDRKLFRRLPIDDGVLEWF